MDKYVKVYHLNYSKYFIRSVLVRPFNIILLPFLIMSYFCMWLFTSDEGWQIGEKFCNTRFEPEKKLAKEMLWWDLKSSCISECYKKSD
jgi:hypothetical protein